MYLRILIAGFVIVLFCSCNNFDFGPYQIINRDEYQDINSKNISRFINTKTDTVIIAVTGDTQRFYEATEKTIIKINNTPNINFVVHTGDLVDFGLQKEFTIMHEQLSQLKYPYVAVVGNHDLIANGGEIYNLMYGDYNFSFTFNRNKFIYLNTNSREYNFDQNVPDIKWLEYELKDTFNYKNAIIVCHVSHMDNDFNADLKDEYIEVLRKYEKVLLSINGHDHNFSFTPQEDDNIAFLNTYSISNEKFVLVKIWNTSFSYEIID